jgi:hypothetical protein
MIRSARDLRAGDKLEISRRMVTVKFVSYLPARLEERTMEMMTRGRDLEGTVVVEARDGDGRTVRHEFLEGEVVTIH